LRDYAEIFSNVESETDLVERFRNSFPTKRSYWSHVFRHAVPRKVLIKYGITNWKEAMMHSEVILPYQVEYAKIALDALVFIRKAALVEEENNPVRKIAVISKHKSMVLFLESTGAFASVYKLDKFKNWSDWLASELKRNSVLEVPIDEEIRSLAERIRNYCKGYL